MFCRHLKKSISNQQAIDVVKDVSKYLFKRDSKDVNPSYMEDGSGITRFIEECMALGLGISGAVNKLTALLAAAKFHNPDSSAIHHEGERKQMSAKKASMLKQRRSPSPLR